MTERVTHFSDGEGTACGVLDEPAVLDPQDCNCVKCLEVMAEKAEKAGDPLVKVMVIDNTLKEGQDFNFVYQREPILTKDAKGRNKLKKAYDPLHYHLISGNTYSLPKSTVEHMESLAWPVKKYVAGQEEGQSMVVSGKRHRFIVSRL